MHEVRWVAAKHTAGMTEICYQKLDSFSENFFKNLIKKTF